MNSTEVRRRWADRSGAYSPAYYAYYGPNETSESVREVVAAHAPPDPAVLELGCSSGRHLAHLHEHGYRDLYGIEINGDAFEVMETAYPDLAEAGTFYEEAIERTVTDFDDGRFDVVYSVQTLQHLHADAEWVFAELARITDALLVTVEQEPSDDREERDDRSPTYVDGEIPLYYRDWREVFTDLGLREVDTASTKRATLRAFRAESSAPDGRTERRRETPRRDRDE